MTEVKEDAEKALVENEPIVTQEDNPMFNDMMALSRVLANSAETITWYLNKWMHEGVSRDAIADLINLRTALEKQSKNTSYM